LRMNAYAGVVERITDSPHQGLATNRAAVAAEMPPKKTRKILFWTNFVTLCPSARKYRRRNPLIYLDNPLRGSLSA
jgi:hypothetical protein